MRQFWAKIVPCKSALRCVAWSNCAAWSLTKHPLGIKDHVSVIPVRTFYPSADESRTLMSNVLGASATLISSQGQDGAFVTERRMSSPVFKGS